MNRNRSAPIFRNAASAPDFNNYRQRSSTSSLSTYFNTAFFSSKIEEEKNNNSNNKKDNLRRRNSKSMSSASDMDFVMDAAELAVVQEYQDYSMGELLTRQRQLKQLIDLKNSILVQQLKRRDILTDEVEGKLKEIERLNQIKCKS